MAKKQKKRMAAPVPDARDKRAEEAENDGSGRNRKPAAPDGVSGSWK
jgi:hypothetical protein